LVTLHTSPVEYPFTMLYIVKLGSYLFVHWVATEDMAQPFIVLLG